MVRGFWGDIINSPYFSFGNEIWKEPERTRFLKEVNYQRVYSNADISEYNIQSYIHKLEEMTDYEYPFERLKSILGDQYDNPKDKAKAEAYKKQQEAEKRKKAKPEVIEEKKEEEEEDEEPMIKEIDEEEEKQIEEDKKKKAQEEEKKAKEAEEENNVIKESKGDAAGGDLDEKFKKLKEGPKKINLLDIDEGESVVAKENEGTRRLLTGFK